MIRLSQLPRECYLDLIEEARWQNGQEFVQDCIRIDARIDELCEWDKTRQGHNYWAGLNAHIQLINNLCTN